MKTLWNIGLLQNLHALFAGCGKRRQNRIALRWKGFFVTGICVVLLGFCTPFACAQETYMRYYEQQGDRAFEAGCYEAARKYYKMALRFQVRNDTLLYKCAEAARKYNHYDEAEYLYLKLLEYQADTLFPELKLRLGEMALYNDNPFSGKDYLDAYMSQQESGTARLSLAKLLYEQCRWAEEHYKAGHSVKIIHLGKEINSKHSETSPVLVMKNRLYFASLRPYAEETQSDIIPSGSISHIYESLRTDTLTFGQAHRVDEKINTEYAHTTHVAFDEKGKRLFLTRCDLSQKSPVYSIYVSEWRNNKMTKPKKLKGSVHAKGFSSMHPTIAYGEGETLLFFSSDRPGGMGGFDIWYVVLNGNTTSNPVNLGYPVNSSKDEITPYYCKDSALLYFSSNGHLGYGGFDIFKSKGYKNSWTPPQNLLKPINSPANDLYYFTESETGLAFLSSNRKGSFFEDNQTCCNDIYAVRVIRDSVKSDTVTPVIPEKCDSCRLQRIQSLLPIVLYFDNDLPHKAEHDSLAKEPFGILADAYLRSKNRFSAAYSHGLPAEEEDLAKQQIALFFDSLVEPEQEKMKRLLDFMYADLTQGKKVVLSIKGFASPLHTSEYNRWLSKRRIHSFVKELLLWKNGRLAPFIQGSKTQTPTLTINELVLGSTTADESVGKSSNNLRQSVFSPEASKERRVEVLYYEYLP